MCSVGVAARGRVRRGGVSRAFVTADLLRPRATHVFIEEDQEGWVVCGEGPGGAAAAARLAPHVHARSAELCVARAARADHAEPLLQLRLLADLSSGDEVLLWFDEYLLALVDMPFLTLRNIRGKKDYVCHNCNVQFEHPNYLKIHLFLECREYSPPVFWAEFVRRAKGRTGDAGGAGDAVDAVDAGDAGWAAAAQLEALAAAWGRSRRGHVCVYCGKLYSRKYGLKIHIRTHTGYKPLRCRYCLRAFGDPSNLNKHVRLHAGGGARLACALCGHAAPRRRDLQRHLRSAHAHTHAGDTGAAPPPALAALL